jgi:hypothetical protein
MKIDEPVFRAAEGHRGPVSLQKNAIFARTKISSLKC